MVMPHRFLVSHPRTVVGFAVGIVVFLALSRQLAPPVRAVIGWDAGAASFLALATVLFWRTGPERMARRAAREAEGEWTIFWITLGAVAFSLVTVVEALSGASHLPPAALHARIGLVAVTLVLSWLSTQAVFAIRYAHDWYRASAGDGTAGGLRFPGEDRPDYWDFVYFAVVLGMTFQVSDVDVTARRLRRLAALHGFLGFVFNTVIVALTVNLAAAVI